MPYSVDTCRRLEKIYSDLNLIYAKPNEQYDINDTLCFSMRSIEQQSEQADVTCKVEKFVGGGFAGQVYKVRVETIENGILSSLSVGNSYAIKILIPPSKGSLFFRDLIYRIGFQGQFALQSNPAAARSGALWQKFIRRGASIILGSEDCVNDIHATFIDTKLGSCGEISNWVDGRTWLLEVDEHLDELSKWQQGKKTDNKYLGSPEFRAKKEFMQSFVQILHEMGAHEFARQYEWSTWKSQPNCLKRISCDDDPQKGLVAVDFRAGLALLPFLPMSPGDIQLIFKGIGRGTLVQFDRGNLKELEAFIKNYPEQFNDMNDMLSELKECDDVYRNSLPDITNNHIKLLYSPKLWSTMVKSSITGWHIRNEIDKHHATILYKNNILTILFMLISCIPFFGKLLRKFWGDSNFRSHVQKTLIDVRYLFKVLKGNRIKTVIGWHRKGRLTAKQTPNVASSVLRYCFHLPFSLLPVSLHRLFTDISYFRERLDLIIFKPIRLYFNAQEREEWFLDMVVEGEKKRIITKDDAKEIRSQIKEPFIQKYLKSLAVHVCTIPITQVVSFAIAGIFILTHPELDKTEAFTKAALIIAAFQIVPISPGSLARGLYVLYLVIKERNIKDYNIALPLGFFKYIGYLAFPIQMTYRYPTIARFMAGHWATDAIHIIPVFGESGALLEHKIYALFYNWPLTLKRRLNERAKARALKKTVLLPALIMPFVGTFIITLFDYFYQQKGGSIPLFKTMMPLFIGTSFLSGVAISLFSGGANSSKRIIMTLISAIFCGGLYGSLAIFLGHLGTMLPLAIFSFIAWRVFALCVLSIVGLVISELVTA